MAGIFDHPAVTFVCRRCGTEIPAGGEETCWYCGGPLCFECWDAVGHCGHDEAERINTEVRRQTQGAGDVQELPCGCRVVVESMDLYHECAQVTLRLDYCDAHGEFGLFVGPAGVRIEPRQRKGSS